MMKIFSELFFGTKGFNRSSGKLLMVQSVIEESFLMRHLSIGNPFISSEGVSF